jgi:hypothetical protein
MPRPSVLPFRIPSAGGQGRQTLAVLLGRRVIVQSEVVSVRDCMVVLTAAALGSLIRPNHEMQIGLQFKN